MNVLSVGASIEHIQSMKIAKELGYKVIAVDGNENSEGFKYADIYLNIDLKEEQKIIEIAKKYDVKCVLPAPLGRYLTTVGAINDKLNLKGITKIAAENCVDKYKSNKLIHKEDEWDFNWNISKSKEQILENVKKIGFPCILKPRFGSGNRGIIVLENEQRLEEIIDEHIKDRKDDDTIIEEFIDGIEYGIDGIIINGEVKIVLIREKKITKLPYRQVLEYICLNDINKTTENKIKSKLNNVCKNLELNNTIIHADIILKNRSVHIIEISGRPSGYFISKKVVEIATGINFLKEGIEFLLGNKFEFHRKKYDLVGINYLDFLEGNIIQIPSNKKIENLKGILESNILIENGCKLIDMKNGQDIYYRGYIIFTCKNRSEIKNIKKEVRGLFEYE